MTRVPTETPSSRPIITTALALAALWGCSDDPASVDPISQVTKTPATDNQQADAGTMVARSPEVTLTRASGEKAVGETVTFAVQSGGGSITGAVAVTDTRGTARVATWTLGPAEGPNTLTATADGIQVIFQAIGVPGPATGLALEDGDEQTGQVGDTLAVRPTVRAVDQFGNGVDGVVVQWKVTQGGGSIVGSNTTTTERGGFASVGQWQMGPNPGPNKLEASATGFPPVEFEATAVP